MSPTTTIIHDPEVRILASCSQELKKEYPDSDADRIIAEKRVEIKSSTLWETGTYKFQQLRDQNYEYVICLGISPFEVHCWLIPKYVIMEKWQNDIIKPQHGGADGSDTAWIQVDPSDPPVWMRDWGDRLSDVADLVSKITNQKPLA